MSILLCLSFYIALIEVMFIFLYRTVFIGLTEVIFTCAFLCFAFFFVLLEVMLIYTFFAFYHFSLYGFNNACFCFVSYFPFLLRFSNLCTLLCDALTRVLEVLHWNNKEINTTKMPSAPSNLALCHTMKKAFFVKWHTVKNERNTQ